MTHSAHDADSNDGQSKVRIPLSSEEDLYHRYAVNLRSGGLFVRDNNPAAVGSTVLVEFVLPHDVLLSRIVGRVAHARRPRVKDDTTAGMGIQFVEYDAVATMVLQDLGIALAPNETLNLQLEGPVFSEVVNAEVVTLDADEGPVIGIDFGTTNMCAAIVDGGKARVILSTHGYETTPSVVYITEDRKVIAGHGALHEMVLRPDRAIYGFKRFIGRAFESREVQTFGHFFSYALAPGKSGRAAVNIDDVVVPLEVVAAYVLSEVRKMASKSLQRTVRRCVLTVPAYFGEMQRRAIRDAARVAADACGSLPPHSVDVGVEKADAEI